MCVCVGVLCVRVGVRVVCGGGVAAVLCSVCRECDLMKFYQTYLKYCLAIHAKKEALAKAKVLYVSTLSKLGYTRSSLPM